MVTVELAPLSVGATDAPLGVVASFSQRLPWPDKIALDDAAAKTEALAAARDYETARRDLALAAALLYDDYYVAARAIDVNAHHVALSRDLHAASLAQLEVGRASAQDPLAAEAELAHMEHDGVRLASQRDVLVARMNELLHRDPNAPIAPPPATLEVHAGGAGHARPEIEADELRARAAEHRARRARRDRVPDLVLSTSYNSMWDWPEHRWMVGVGLTIPIQLGHRAGAVDEAEAERARYEHAAAAMTDKVRTEIAVARRRMEEAEHVLHLFDERLVPIAPAQIDAARAGFVSSRNDFIAVLAAEKNLRSVEIKPRWRAPTSLPASGPRFQALGVEAP